MATLAEIRSSQISDVRAQLNTMLGQFAAVLPSHIPPKLFARVVLTAIQNRPELLECDRRSLWNASMRAAQDGLLPDGRLGAMVIFKDKRLGKVAQWMPMIAGIRQKVRNSGEVATWECHVVRERDLYEFELGDNARIVHRPARGQRGPIVACYSIAVLKSGERSREWMWLEEIEDIRKRSRSPDEGPWVTDYAEMARKTVAKRHSKVLPMSTDILALLERDIGHLPEAEAPPTAPEAAAPPRALTDALNMLAGTQPEHDQQDRHDDAEQPAEDVNPETGELTQAASDPAQQQPEQQPDLLQQQVDEQTELNRARVMLTEAAEQGQTMLEEFWSRLPKNMQKQLRTDYQALKFRG